MSNSGLIRILAADDHALLRNGIAGLVNDEPDMKMVAEAGTGAEAIKQFKQYHPDIWHVRRDVHQTGFKLSTIRQQVREHLSFEGHEVPPVVRAVPGGVIQLEYVNQMSRSSSEVCVDGPCMNGTNLHFHGLRVSPDAPGDDVLTMMAMPGESLHYAVDIPADQPPGLYWYHTHPHGESYQQALDGMSGAIVIDGMDRYFPEIKNMKEKILILRDAELKQGDPSSALLTGAVELAPYGCGAATGKATRVFTVNGVARPKMAIAYGEKQFWRIVNASPDLYADLEVDSESMTVVALDGMPLTYHDPTY